MEKGIVIQFKEIKCQAYEDIDKEKNKETKKDIILTSQEKRFFKIPPTPLGEKHKLLQFSNNDHSEEKIILSTILFISVGVSTCLKFCFCASLNRCCVR